MSWMCVIRMRERNAIKEKKKIFRILHQRTSNTKSFMIQYKCSLIVNNKISNRKKKNKIKWPNAWPLNRVAVIPYVQVGKYHFDCWFGQSNKHYDLAKHIHGRFYPFQTIEMVYGLSPLFTYRSFVFFFWYLLNHNRAPLHYAKRYISWK